MLLALSLVAVGCKSNAAADEIKPADCPAFTEKGRLPATPAEAEAPQQKGTSWSNREIRARYVCWATSIGAQVEQWKAEGVPLPERAKRAFQARHDARMTARAMMSNPEAVRALEARGATVWRLLPPEAEGRDGALREVLMRLAALGANEVLVEAGATLAGSFVRAGLVDEFVLYLAPTLLGSAARPLLELPLLTMDRQRRLQITDVRQVGGDIRILARPEA